MSRPEAAAPASPELIRALFITRPGSLQVGDKYIYENNETCLSNIATCYSDGLDHKVMVSTAELREKVRNANNINQWF